MSYSNIIGHRPMVFDEHRNSLYANAINKCVNSNSVVLDLGAGLGIHGLMAARAGAKKVYLVEPVAELDVAAKIARQNDLSEKIQYIQGTIEESHIPESVDVIISVFTGNFLLEEDLLPSLFYARDKYLKPGGILVPDRAKMEVVPVSAPDYFNKYISGWSQPAQGIDFRLVREYAANNIYYDDHRELADGLLAEPAEIMEIDFMVAKKAECRCSIEVKITKEGNCHGLLGWFQTRLGDTWLSTSPLQPKTHWSQAFLPIDPPMPVAAGDVMSFRLQRPEFGEWTWTVKTGNTSQKHSTFLSQPVLSSVVQKKTDDYKAALNTKGQAAMYVLKKLDGNASTTDIATELVQAWPQIFPDLGHARRFVINLIERFA
jgi:SAM-dependent methyltransferase